MGTDEGGLESRDREFNPTSLHEELPASVGY